MKAYSVFSVPPPRLRGEPSRSDRTPRFLMLRGTPANRIEHGRQVPASVAKIGLDQARPPLARTTRTQ